MSAGNENRYIAALEKQNRILRVLAGLSCVALVLIIAMAAQSIVPPPLVVGETLIVKDRNGIDRFELVVDSNDGRANGFHVVDATGQTRIDIGITTRGEPIIAFLDAKGRVVRTLR